MMIATSASSSMPMDESTSTPPAPTCSPAPPMNKLMSSSTPATSSSPSLRGSLKGGPSIAKRTKIRKSPRWNMGIGGSPLSRMLLTPRAQFRVRSPSSTRGTSPGGRRMLAELDLNLLPVDTDLTIEDAVEDVALNIEEEEVQDVDFDAEQERVQDVGLDVDHEEVQAIDLNIEPEEEMQNASLNAHRKELPDNICRAVFDAVLAKSKNAILMGHETREVSQQFSVPIWTVQRIWRKGKRCLDRGIPVDVSSGKKRRGRKKIEVDVSTLSTLDIGSRSTIEDLSTHFHVSKSKVHSMKRDGTITRVSNSIKPYLTDQNKKERLKWCFSMLDPRTIPTDPLFKDLFDFVFIDEKWFNITRKNERYYAVPGEEPIERTCKSKTHIPKLMILTAFARPRFDSEKNCTFDGKIGCFPFIKFETAKRSSVNRPAGAIEMKPLDSVDKIVTQEFMIEKVLPAIRARWPQEDANKPIFIQQDNAKPHLSPNDKLFCDVAKKDGFDIRIVCQPPNSPDLNVLDLGFFNSIQSLQYKTKSKTLEDLVAAVDKAFREYSVEKANRIFLTLQGCMKEIMRIEGGNRYDTPHIRKQMLERQGLLPLQLGCDATLVQEVLAKING